MKAFFFNTKNFEKCYIQALASEKQIEVTFSEETLELDTVHYADGHDAVVVFTNDNANASVLESLSKVGVKYLVTRSAGFDHVDISKAKELGIKVANVPEYSPYSVAEHTVALLLALNRKLIVADKNVKQNNYKLDALIGFDLNEKTVGIIGVGRIGGIIAKIMKGFGCDLLGYDIYPNAEFSEQYGLSYTSLDELYSQSDIIIIQTPLNEKTKYLINKDSISKMKDGVFIINSARGGVLKTIDAIEALKSGKIGALGIDVYEREKGLFFYDHSLKLLKDDELARLYTFPNVLVTGHQAFLTQEALNDIFNTTFSSLMAWKHGENAEFEL
ncbi:MAG: 2-hydroxyacid dehydrogenase [Cytophagales bacterium]